MARVTHNLLLQGISGKVGPLVVRQVGGQTVVQAAEAKAARAPRSPRQQAHLNRFYQAQLYAKAQLRDPAVEALYATRTDDRRRSAYAVAVADFMHAPKIIGLDTRAYHGRPGDVLRVQATDDFAVVGVHLCLLAASGALLEEGEAILQADGCWHYLVQQAQVPATCEVTAHDRPGNTARQVYSL